MSALVIVLGLFVWAVCGVASCAFAVYYDACAFDTFGRRDQFLLLIGAVLWPFVLVSTAAKWAASKADKARDGKVLLPHKQISPRLKHKDGTP